MKGYGFYLVVLAIVFLTVFLSDNIEINNDDAYTYARFVNDVDQGKVSYVDIYPNEEVNTGQVKVRFNTQEQRRSFNVSDVRVIEDILNEADVEFNMHKISKPNWF